MSPCEVTELCDDASAVCDSPPGKFMKIVCDSSSATRRELGESDSAEPLLLQLEVSEPK